MIVKSASYLLILFAVLYLFSVFSSIKKYELRAEEPRRAIVSMEMLYSENYIVPTINGEHYYNKPPVFNWVMIVFFRLFKTFDEWVVRLPSLLSLILTAILNIFFIRRFVGIKTAILSSVFFLTSADILFYGTVVSGEIDLFFTLIIYLSVMSQIIFCISGKELNMFLVSYMFAAIGFLTKGFPALAFQVITLIVVTIYFRKLKALFSLKHLSGIILFMVTVGIYFFAYFKDGDIIRLFANMIYESTSRYGEQSGFYQKMSWIKFPFVILPNILLPWFLIIFVVLAKSVRRNIIYNKFITAIILVFLANILLYWISPHVRLRYLYPLLPFACIFLAYCYNFGVHSDNNKYRKVINIIWGICIIIIAVTVIIIYFVPVPLSKNYKIAAIPTGIILLVIAYFYFTSRELKIYWLAISLVILRIGYNYTYLSYMSDNILKDSVYVKNMLKISGKNEVFLTGNMQEQQIDLKLLSDKPVSIYNTPYLPYEISYYFFKLSGKPLIYNSHPDSGSYCIAVNILNTGNNLNELYSFKINAGYPVLMYKNY